MNPWDQFTGVNAGYVHELYERDGRIRRDVLVLGLREPLDDQPEVREDTQLAEDADSRSADSALDEAPLQIDPAYNTNDQTVLPEVRDGLRGWRLGRGRMDERDQAVRPRVQHGKNAVLVGPSPGEPGTSVLAAHVDYDGRPGAFFRLRDLAVGERVEVTMSDGSVAVLSVTGSSQVDKGDLAAAGVFDRSGPSRIALITCGGEFDRSRRSYEDNVVAIAEPVG